jgi:dTDP-4-dehydrorhamnose 3,5-epimerase
VLVQDTELPGVRMFTPRVFEDVRGRFWETWRLDRYQEAGTGTFVQDNTSVSVRDTIRGLHFQHPRAQGKLIQVAQGTVYDVAVDIRRGSPHFMRWVGVELSAENGRQLWIPPGFAHGFAVLSETAVLHYKCSDYYAPDCEHGIRWDDPSLGITWPISAPHLSNKDAAAPLLTELPEEHLPRYDASASRE